jgi:hypothetical protein
MLPSSDIFPIQTLDEIGARLPATDLYADASVQPIDWQLVAVIACIFGAIVYLTRHFVRPRRTMTDSPCGSGGCAGCPASGRTAGPDRLTEDAYVSIESLQESGNRLDDVN